MKKLIKSKMFLVIITMIICISGTLYATNTYNSNSILYITSNGETTNVNEALNDLYENMNNVDYADFKLGNRNWTFIQSSYTIITYNVETTGTVLLTWFSTIYTCHSVAGTVNAFLYLNDEVIDSKQVTDNDSSSTTGLTYSNQLKVDVKEGDVLKIIHKSTYYSDTVCTAFLMGNYIK